VRGSNDIDYKERIRIMKQLWDAIGTEFGARHELYEMNYSGSHELVRLFPLQQAQASGALKEMEALVERCMADCDEDSSARTSREISPYFARCFGTGAAHRSAFVAQQESGGPERRAITMGPTAPLLEGELLFDLESRACGTTR
jgi:4-hydroxyphenylacetate 3-hydroxylase C terminal